MQLIYRGTTFNYNPAHINDRCPVQCSESAYKLIYRGNTYRVDPTVATIASAKPMEYKLIYRGSTYQVSRNEQDEMIAIAPSTSALKRKTLTISSAMQKSGGEYSL